MRGWRKKSCQESWKCFWGSAMRLQNHYHFYPVVVSCRIRTRRMCCVGGMQMNSRKCLVLVTKTLLHFILFTTRPWTVQTPVDGNSGLVSPINRSWVGQCASLPFSTVQRWTESQVIYHVWSAHKQTLVWHLSDNNMMRTSPRLMANYRIDWLTRKWMILGLVLSCCPPHNDYDDDNNGINKPLNCLTSQGHTLCGHLPVPSPL